MTSSKDAPKDDKKKGSKKEVFYFSYDFPTQKLTHLKDKEEEPKRLGWGSVSPDKKTVIYAKDLNLYRMSYEDYQKARKDEKDSTIVEIQLTTDGVEDFGYGMPYSMMNTDTLCNGKRRPVYGYWSPDSRHFATILTDNRAVKDLWVIDVTAKRVLPSRHTNTRCRARRKPLWSICMCLTCRITAARRSGLLLSRIRR